VMKLSADGSTLIYSTLLGGSAGDATTGIAVDAAGNAYVVGSTCAPDFPTTAEAFSMTQISSCGLVYLGPNGDGFIAKLSSDGSRLLYGTYFGGTGHDEGSGGIAVDSAGNVYVAGRTRSDDFPTTLDAFEPGGGLWDAFVAKLSITDTDRNPGTLGFDAIGYSVREDAGEAVITVIRRNGKDGEVSVDYATTPYCCHPWLNWTPTDGSDYVATSGTLVFADGETSKSFTIPILDDGEHEDDERLVVTLSNVQGGATLGGNRTAVWLTIMSNDPIFLPTLTVNKTGTGSGIVNATVFGFYADINCGSDCSQPYPMGTAVTLTAFPQVGSTFAGWSGGGCSGTGPCTVTMNADTSVTATFTVTTAITVTSANGGENWRRAKKQTIRWAYIGNIGVQVRIDLLKAGVVNQTTLASVGSRGSGSLTWKMSKHQELGSDYAIRICSISSPSICDTSDRNFTISK